MEMRWLVKAVGWEPDEEPVLQYREGPGSHWKTVPVVKMYPGELSREYEEIEMERKML